MDNWNKEKMNYNLGNTDEDFILEPASIDEYSQYYAVYFQNAASFPSSFQDKRNTIADTDTCFWINKSGKRIGGVLLEPNYLEDLFLIPPYRDYGLILSMLKDFLFSISNKGEDIQTYVSDPNLRSILRNLGFKEKASGRWMLSATRKCTVEWNPSLKLLPPDTKYTKELGTLFFEAFKTAPVEQFPLEKRIEFVEYYFKHNSHLPILKDASSLVFDENGDLIGACLISLFKEWPLVYDIAVRDDYRGQGLASTLLKKSLSALHKNYPAVRLHVDMGNPAEKVYLNNGFIPGPAITEMFIPAENSQEKR